MTCASKPADEQPRFNAAFWRLAVRRMVERARLPASATIVAASTHRSLARSRSRAKAHTAAVRSGKRPCALAFPVPGMDRRCRCWNGAVSESCFSGLEKARNRRGKMHERAAWRAMLSQDTAVVRRRMAVPALWTPYVQKHQNWPQRRLEPPTRHGHSPTRQTSVSTSDQPTVPPARIGTTADPANG